MTSADATDRLASSDSFAVFNGGGLRDRAATNFPEAFDETDSIYRVAQKSKLLILALISLTAKINSLLF